MGLKITNTVLSQIFDIFDDIFKTYSSHQKYIKNTMNDDVLQNTNSNYIVYPG